MKTFTKQVENPCLEIRFDDSAESPREWDNLGYFITSESRRSSPDKNVSLEAIVKETGEEAASVTEHMAMIKHAMRITGEKVLKIYPVARFEHGGVAYSLGTKHGFDYSNCGFYIITEKTAGKESSKRFEMIVAQEIKIYNQWINGEVYSYVLYDADGECIDSCGGFYDIEDIRENLPKEWAKEDLAEYLIH